MTIDIIGALLPEKLQPRAKAIIFIIGFVLTLLSMHFTDSTFIDVGLQVLTGLGVYVQPNFGYSQPARKVAKARGASHRA